jgi:hypothetical protein
MHVIRWATAAVLCAFAITPIAVAQQAPPPADATKLPPPAAKYEHVWPKVLPQGKAETSSQAPAEWSKQEIELAQARCTAMLKGLDVVALPDAAIREGTDCGTPAPMRLLSIGSNPQIAFSPPPTLTCDMIAALHRWLQRDVQPLARKHLGAPVVSMATMSSYSCRNAYGRKSGRLSEHGRVNALDIGAFVTAKGQTTMVVADWGPIAREIAAQAAAAQKQREAEAAAAAARQKNGVSPQPDSPAPVATQQPLRPSIAIDMPGISVQILRPDAPTALGLTQPNRLGGPKQGDAALPAPVEALTGKAQFLRAAHRAACGIFGTVLGPEANSAHKNHFHVDMAERKHRSICE